MPSANGRSRPQITMSRIRTEAGPALEGVQRGSGARLTNTQVVHKISALPAKASPVLGHRTVTNRRWATRGSVLSRLIQLIGSRGSPQLGAADGRQHIRCVQSLGKVGFDLADALAMALLVGYSITEACIQNIRIGG